jgi:uncharacterized protein (DUF433 family)
MDNWKERVSVNPAICHGKRSRSCGDPYQLSPLKPEDVDAALAYAAELAREGAVDLPLELGA